MNSTSSLKTLEASVLRFEDLGKPATRKVDPSVYFDVKNEEIVQPSPMKSYDRSFPMETLEISRENDTSVKLVVAKSKNACYEWELSFGGEKKYSESDTNTEALELLRTFFKKYRPISCVLKISKEFSCTSKIVERSGFSFSFWQDETTAIYTYLKCGLVGKAVDLKNNKYYIMSLVNGYVNWDKECASFGTKEWQDYFAARKDNMSFEVISMGFNDGKKMYECELGEIRKAFKQVGDGNSFERVDPFCLNDPFVLSKHW